MKDVRELVTLYNYVGIYNPYWRLSEDCNVLHFSTDETADAEQTIELSPEQADRVREMMVITSSLSMTLPVEDDDIPVYLVGWEISKHEWAGSAPAWDDTPSITRDLAQGLSFAGQVASEANSVVVILDRMGNIQRSNRLCEEYTGLREREVVDQSVFALFMSRRKAAASRHNIEVFFREDNSYEVERRAKTYRGQRLFLFCSKFIYSGSGKNEIFLICPDTDITEERRAQKRLRMLANTDSITGLPNRNAIHELISDAIEDAGDTQVGTVYLGLDSFKEVNDAYGHMLDDQLL